MPDQMPDQMSNFVTCTEIADFTKSPLSVIKTLIDQTTDNEDSIPVDNIPDIATKLNLPPDESERLIEYAKLLVESRNLVISFGDIQTKIENLLLINCGIPPEETQAKLFRRSQKLEELLKDLPMTVYEAYEVMKKRGFIDEYARLNQLGGSKKYLTEEDLRDLTPLGTLVACTNPDWEASDKDIRIRPGAENLAKRILGRSWNSWRRDDVKAQNPPATLEQFKSCKTMKEFLAGTGISSHMAFRLMEKLGMIYYLDVNPAASAKYRYKSRRLTAKGETIAHIRIGGDYQGIRIKPEAESLLLYLLGAE